MRASLCASQHLCWLQTAWLSIAVVGAQAANVMHLTPSFCLYLSRSLSVFLTMHFFDKRSTLVCLWFWGRVCGCNWSTRSTSFDPLSPLWPPFALLVALWELPCAPYEYQFGFCSLADQLSSLGCFLSNQIPNHFGCFFFFSFSKSKIQLANSWDWIKFAS